MEKLTYNIQAEFEVTVIDGKEIKIPYFFVYLNGIKINCRFSSIEEADEFAKRLVTYLEKRLMSRGMDGRNSIKNECNEDFKGNYSFQENPVIKALIEKFINAYNRRPLESPDLESPVRSKPSFKP